MLQSAQAQTLLASWNARDASGKQVSI